MDKKAFTLFELMVVVMIIGVVYALVLGSFDPKKSIKVVTLENIKDTMITNWSKGTKIDLIVYDKCHKTAVLINNEINEDIEVDINSALFKDIKVYKSDRYGSQREIGFAPLLVDGKLYKVCFKFTIFPNGSSSSYIVKSGKKYYLYFPYFENCYVTTNLDDALESYQKKEFTKITVHE